MALTIERLHPRDGIAEKPYRKGTLLMLADPKHGKEKHHAKHAIYVPSLEEAADLIENRGFSIWMIQDRKRASLICPTSLRVSRT